jgi:hypothetical protein
MDREESRRLLDAKLNQYRKLSYAELSSKIGHDEFLEVVGPSGTEYQIEIQIRWDHKPDGDIRVMGRHRRWDVQGRIQARVQRPDREAR